MLVMQYIQYCGIGIGTRLESLVHVHETIIIWRETEIAGPYFADSAQKEAAVDALYLELYILHFTPANHANDAEMNVQEGLSCNHCCIASTSKCLVAVHLK